MLTYRGRVGGHLPRKLHWSTILILGQNFWVSLKRCWRPFVKCPLIFNPANLILPCISLYWSTQFRNLVTRGLKCFVHACVTKNNVFMYFKGRAGTSYTVKGDGMWKRAIGSKRTTSIIGKNTENGEGRAKNAMGTSGDLSGTNVSIY